VGHRVLRVSFFDRFEAGERAFVVEDVEVLKPSRTVGSRLRGLVWVFGWARLGVAIETASREVSMVVRINGTLRR